MKTRPTMHNIVIEQHIKEDEKGFRKKNAKLSTGRDTTQRGKATELRKFIDYLNDRDEVIFLSMANIIKEVRLLGLFLNTGRIKIPEL